MSPTYRPGYTSGDYPIGLVIETIFEEGGALDSVDSQAVFHVGLGKCASTFLQRNYFNILEGWEYQTTNSKLDQNLRFIFEVNAPFDKIKGKRGYLRSSAELNGSGIIRRWKKRTERFISNAEGKNILISSEGLAGVAYNPLRNNLDICCMLKDLFAERRMRIIFIFRKQSEYCESQYRQLIYKENRFKKHLAFEDLWSTEFTNRALATVYELDWMRIYKNYISCFGYENVLALPLEMMSHELENFKARMDAFLGVTTNVGSGFYTKKENATPLGKGNFSKKFRFRDLQSVFEGLSAPARHHIDFIHANNNRILSEQIGIDLHKYGYY